jgi:hypothetical protein
MDYVLALHGLALLTPKRIVHLPPEPSPAKRLHRLSLHYAPTLNSGLMFPEQPQGRLFTPFFMPSPKGIFRLLGIQHASKPFSHPRGGNRQSSFVSIV